MSDEKKKFNVALVGCGVISANHLDAISLLDYVEVVALCDVDLERAAKKRTEFNLNCRIYSSYEKMLESELLDAIHIATPHYLHAEMAVSALRRGINVFLEKPAAINDSELEMMLEEEKKSSGRVCICYQNRFNPTTEYAKHIVASDGGAMTVQASVIWKRDKAYYDSAEWRGKRLTEGGGVMINQAIHTVDLLCSFLGKPKAVTATCANHHLKDVIDVEDSCEGMIEFEGGTFANFYATTAATIYDTTSLLIATKNHVIEIRNSNLYVDGERIRGEELNFTYYGKSCYGGGHRVLIGRFYEAITTGDELPVPLASSTDALRVIFAAYRSNDKEITL